MGPGFDAKTALVVVDMQNDFADPAGALSVRDAEAVFPALEALLAQATEAGSVVVYTKDWHPPTTPHFKANGGIWPPHCVQNTWGAQLHPALPRVSPAVFIHKGQAQVDGYSAFTVIDPVTSASHETGLRALLQRFGVERVVVAGLATDYCVKHTALDARHFGFETRVAKDAVRAVDLQPEDGERALAEMARAGATLF